MAYRCEAPTIEGFVQQLAVSYVAHGYWFYVTGIVPERKDPRLVDEKLISKYGIDISKFSRARRKVAGWANVQYLRHERFFVLVATHGQHRFFASTDEGGEGERIRDLRRVPLKFASYSISYRGGHSHVRIEEQTFRDLKAYFVELATLRTPERLEALFRNLPFEPYVPVCRQSFSMLNKVNWARHVAGLEPISRSCLRMRRRIVRPFEPLEKAEAA
jgi:hypothetical protein